MSGLWRKIVHNTTVQVNAILSRQRSDLTRQRLRILKYCTLVLIAGVGCRQWLLPFARAAHKDDNPLMLKSQKQETEPPCRREVLFWWDKSGSSNSCRSSPAHTHRGRFRDITIREYENRLRIYSQPEKIFCYFATIQTQNSAGQWEVYMTPVDFLRSMMPGIRQPDGLGLNQFRRMSREDAQKLSFKCVPADSIFYTIRPDGLLTFTDYLYLHMLVPMPEHYFQIGFNIFGTNGDAALNWQGMNHLLHGVTGYARFKANNSVNHYFFGPDLDGKLSLEKFLSFKRKLARDILLIEFNLLHLLDRSKAADKETCGEKETISELAFSTLLLSYSSLPRTDKMATLQRIKKKYKNSKRGVTLEEFRSFFKFVDKIPTIDIALTYHFLAGADISRLTLKRISDIVVGVPLSSHIVDIIFTVFDTDNNGVLGRAEFLQAIRHRMARKRRINPLEILQSVFKCGKQALFV